MSEKTREKIAKGKKEEDVYSEEGREELLEDDEIEPFEEGFMEGAEGRGKKNCCAECGKLLGEEDVFERQFGDETRWFCSEEHAENYAKRMKKKVSKSVRVKRR
jgi:hypothetical protein